MRTTLLLFAFIALWGFALRGESRYIKMAEISSGEPRDEEARTLRIDGIDCECCACFIVVKATKITGVKSALDLPAIGMVVIEYYESKVNAERLIRAIEEMGFEFKVRSFDSTAKQKEKPDMEGNAN